jgi:hypothetical protein
MARVRKATTAALAAAAAVLTTALTAGGTPSDTAGWAQLGAGALAAGVLAWVATYFTKNEPPRPSLPRSF